MNRLWIVVLLVVGLSCSRDALSDADDGDASSGGSSGPIATGTSGPNPTTTTTGGDPTGDTSDGTTGPGLMCMDDPEPPRDDYCNPFIDTCPAGEKCMWWANDGGTAWNATQCFPMVDNPNRIGEPCTAFGSGVSGLDDCERGAICFDVDRETLEGTCVGYCQCSEQEAQCADECSRCSISGSGFALCLPMCDVLAQDCPNDAACFALGNGQSACAPAVIDPGEGELEFPCEFVNACAQGFMCVNSTALPGCDPATSGCCSPYCDTSDPNACAGLGDGVACQPLELESTACVDASAHGVCALPV